MLIFMNNVSGTPLEFHKFTTQKEAEDFVYASYLRAATHQDYAAQDDEISAPAEIDCSLCRRHRKQGKRIRCQYDFPDPADKFIRRTDDQSSYYGFQRALPRQ